MLTEPDDYRDAWADWRHRCHLAYFGIESPLQFRATIRP